jgi:hypothetical protein
MNLAEFWQSLPAWDKSYIRRKLLLASARNPTHVDDDILGTQWEHWFVNFVYVYETSRQQAFDTPNDLRTFVAINADDVLEALRKMILPKM